MMVSGCDEPMARFWILTMEFGTRALGKCGWIFNRFYRCAAAAASGVASGFELVGARASGILSMPDANANGSQT